MNRHLTCLPVILPARSRIDPEHLERRGRHSGLVCAVKGCEKFARMTDTGLRR